MTLSPVPLVIAVSPTLTVLMHLTRDQLSAPPPAPTMENVPTLATQHPEVLCASVTLATTSLVLQTPPSAWILTNVPSSVPAPSTAPTPRGLSSVPVLLDILRKAATAGQGESHPNCYMQSTVILMVL